MKAKNKIGSKWKNGKMEEDGRMEIANLERIKKFWADKKKITVSRDRKMA